MKIFLLYLSLLSTPAIAQVKLKTFPLKASEIPEKLYQGKTVQSNKIIDASGESIILLSETGVLESKKEEGGWYANLYAYKYKKRDTGWQLMWRVYDFIPECEVDVTCEFIPGSLTVTDLNNNGKAEITFIYKLSCRGDVSPDALKLILYEGNSKYAIRGEMLVIAGPDKFGGQKIIDKSFNSAPKAFLAHANKLWEKHKTMKY